MNSRNSLNEKNIVKFSNEVSLNQREAKDRIEIPFDHIYACHSRSAEIQRPNLQLAKEVEITTQCTPHDPKSLLATSCDVSTLRDRVAGYERKVKKLKNLLIHHIDLTQLQSDYATKREKHFQAIKQENDALRARIIELEKGIGNLRETRQGNRQGQATPNATITQPVHQNTELVLNSSYTELLIPSDRNTFVFDNNLSNTSAYTPDQEPGLKEESETDRQSPELVVTTILDNSVKFPIFNILDSPQSLNMDKTENRTDAVYTISGNSNSSLLRMQKGNRRNAVGTSLGRSKFDQKETKQYEASKSLERKFTLNKKSKMINTYGKSANSTVMKPSQYTGSLTDRLQLIDTTPTGEDPYQLRESDLREQSPIPKLMLQKTNHGRIKICSCENVSNATEPTRRIYDPVVKEKSSDGSCSKTKQQVRYNRQPTYVCRSNDLKKKKDRLSLLVDSTCKDIIKTEPGIDWSMYNARLNHKAKTSVCDFSYGESSSLATQNLPSLDTDEFQNLFSSESPLFQTHDISTEDYNAFDIKGTLDKTKRKGGRTLSFVDTNNSADNLQKNLSANTQKGGRKRALSATGVLKSTGKKLGIKPKYTKSLSRSHSLPSLPVLETVEPYHTTAGDAVWYLGPELDPKPDEIMPPPQPTTTPVVEVPQWRIKIISPATSPIGSDDDDIEVLTDAVFEKRHQKYEIMERRQLKYHLRHLREQKLVEKLRQRQRDKWAAGPSTSTSTTPREFTILPQPHNDIQYIEICDTLPVSAFGENMRQMDDADFKLPWVLRSTTARKRGKRSKTLNT